LHQKCFFCKMTSCTTTLEEISLDRKNTPAPSGVPLKDPATIVKITTAISKNVLFSHLEQQDREAISKAMFPCNAVGGEVVVKQGEIGENFYVIEQGQGTIQVGEPSSKTVVNIPIGDGGSFGELALIYGTPRAATVKANTDMKLWGLARDSYRKILLESAQRKRRQYEDFLAKVPLLENLDRWERLAVADSIQSVSFAAGADVVKQGEEGETFYFIEEGQARVMISRGDGEESQQVGLLGPKDSFGELALLHERPRAATVTAVGQLNCLMMYKDGFDRSLAPCIEALKHQAQSYRGLPNQSKSKK